MTSDQLEFIRAHGITRCPPGPTFDVSWSDPRRYRAFAERTESEALNRLRRGSGVNVTAVGYDLKDGNFGHARDRRWKPGRRSQNSEGRARA
jgi:hypothetical protein